MRPTPTLPRALVLLVLLLLAGCGSDPVQATAPGGADGDAGAIAIRDARFSASPPRSGDEAYTAGQDAPITMTIVNTGDATDRLVGVASPVAEGADVDGDTQLLDGFTLVSHDTSVTLGGGTVATDITLTGLREPLRAGLTYPVTFTFARAGAITLALPIDNPAALPPRAGEPD